MLLAAPGARASADADSSLRAAPEVRGTWVTTTANTALATPADTAKTMRTLREIGLNTVYVETWKNGYTQYPSEVLRRVVGVDRRPNLMPSDPSDAPERLKQPARDLLEESLIEAHRNQLIYIGWFEYGFMAAHKSTPSVHLWKQKPEWLSRDQDGSEIAPNGFVWMNPLHPEARRFLLDLVLEAVDKYDMDGIQLDDRIVWPYVNMGYDDYTKSIYAAEHNGKQPPKDPKDPAWMRWRADKVNEFSKMFVQEIRAKRPGLLISLSPAPYPWVWENYMLEWPKWAGWAASDALQTREDWAGNNITPRWDEFIPQNYRFSYEAFEKTWLEQIEHMKTLGANRQRDLIAGIRIVGDGADSSWDQLRKSIELTRANGNGGHVHWFSRGVLDVYPKELTSFYDVKGLGPAPHPKFHHDWRPAPVVLGRGGEKGLWVAPWPAVGLYHVIAKAAGADGWKRVGWVGVGVKEDGSPVSTPTGEPDTRRLAGSINDIMRDGSMMDNDIQVRLEGAFDAVELLVDRRPAMTSARTSENPVLSP
jgi:uncharacterized lipoprotein YddW (UPF0748 family)